MPSILLKGSPAFCRRCGNIPHRRPTNRDGHFHHARKWLCAYCDPLDGTTPETDLFTPWETMSVWSGAWVPKHPLGPAAVAVKAGTFAMLLAGMPAHRIGVDGRLQGTATCSTPDCAYCVSQNRGLICAHQSLPKTCLFCALTKRQQAEEQQKQLRGIGSRKGKTLRVCPGKVNQQTNGK